jgi:sequestosome 1
MGDNVSFKVFLKKSDEQEVRRFVIDKNVSTSYDYLLEKLRVVFPQIQGSVFTVGWTDEDGDHVTITSDEELIIALTEMAGPLYKLTVTVKNPAVKETGGAVGGAEGAEAVHYGVTCDGCDQQNITGARYKCVVCDDYDLCGTCETAGRHPGHNMMKIITPRNVFPHRLFKRIQKLQEKAEKKTGNEKWNEKLEKDMKQVEEQLKNINVTQCGMSAPPQHCFGFGPRGRGMFRGGRGGMGRGGWAAAGPAWEAMMRGWTGEQPATASGQEKKKEEGEHQKTHAESVAAAEEAAKEAHARAHSAAQASAASAASAAFAFPTMSGSEDYLQNVGSFVAAALDPLGIDVKIDIETPQGRKSCHVSRQASSASAEASAEASASQEKENDDVVNTEEKKEESEPAKKSATSSDDEEEWTVLNDKKEAESEKKEGDGQGPSLYPKLAENPPAEIPSAPVAAHPDPKIQVALQAMMNMGFSNEGGWLSSLLEAKNGDIGKVLDILQPVKK